MRPYQIQWVTEIKNAFQSMSSDQPGSMRAVLGQMPTGAGKTHASADILSDQLAQGRRVAFVAELEESIDDTVDKLRGLGVWCGVVKSGRSSDPLCRAQVCSLWTLIERPQELPPAEFVILDECHKVAANHPHELFTSTWKPQDLLGICAAPERSDKRALSLFKKLVLGPKVRWLQTHGLCAGGHEIDLTADPLCLDCCDVTPYLVPTQLLTPAAFQEKHPAWDPLNAYQAHLQGRKTLVFCSTVREALKVAECFVEAGIPAECVHGGTKGDIRANVRDRITFAEGSYVLTGVDVFLEAWDCPPIDGIIFNRKFSTLVPWLQAWGRGMRASPGKRNLKAVDLWGSYWLHFGPEIDRQWNLEGRPVADTSVIRNARCQTCGYIDVPGTEICALCGDPMRTPRPEPTVQRKPLIDVQSIPDPDKDNQFLQMMYGRCLKAVIPAMQRKNIQIENREHFARGWAYRRFLEKFGREPLPLPGVVHLP